MQSKTKGSQKMTFAEFEKALELIAEKKVNGSRVADLSNVAVSTYLCSQRLLLCRALAWMM